MNTDDEDIRRRGLVMARTEEFQARERHERETAALIGKALEPRGTRQTPPTRIDLDDLERKAHAATQGAWFYSSLDGAILAGPDAIHVGYIDLLNVNEDHVLANSPQVTLALIARIRELEGERDRLAPRAKAADALEVEMAKLLPLADAAEAFVNEQGKRVDVDRGHTIDLPEDFAATEFAALVRAVEGAGR